MASTGLRLPFCAILGVFLVCFKGIDSKWAEGTIDKRSTWEFLTRFCFLSKRSSSEEGGMRYELRYPVEYGVQNLLFYYDTPGQWDSVYKRGKTCQEANDALQGRNTFPLSSSLCTLVVIDNAPWYNCVGKLDFSSSRERWWYMAVSRCGTPSNVDRNGSMYLYYKLHLTNGDDFMHAEFSADEFYIVITDIIFFIMYIIMMVVLIACSVILKKRQLLHTTYKMFMAAVSVWTLHLLCMVYAWTSYGVTGSEKSTVEVLGRMLQAASNIIFMLLLILVAKGYTIVRGKLTKKAKIKIAVFIFLYSVISGAMFIWETAFFDPGLVLYYYESPPGYGLVVITLVGWLWLTKAIIFTLKHYKAKTYFYIIFYSLYTLWFWAGPLVVLLAMFSMSKWTREKTVNGVQQLVGYLGHLIFLMLTLPHKVNSNFPFHTRTAQIGAASDYEEETRDVGPYSVSRDVPWSGTGPNLEFFVTSKGGAGDGGLMYGPLGSSELDPGSSGSGDSPPPSYPQALHAARLPPISTQLQNNPPISTQLQNNPPISTQVQNNQPINTQVQNNHNEHLQHSMENSDSAPPQYARGSTSSPGGSGTHLPPLTRAMTDEKPENERLTLPPLRGSMLPPISPLSAPMYLMNKK